MENTNIRDLPSLNALKVFEAAARHLNFTKAARELNVTQGAVSRQVKQLESELQTILFHRSHRTLTLTDQGRILAQPLTRSLDIMADAVYRLKTQQHDLNLKVHPTFAIRWLIPRLHHFQSKYPGIRVRLTTSSVNVDFTRENFDAGITHLGREIPGVIREEILKEQLVPVCSPILLEADHAIHTPEDLSRHTLLHNSPDMKEWRVWAAQTGVDSLSLERGQIFEVDDAALQAATAGLGVALGDTFLIRDELALGRLVAPLGNTPIHTGSYYFSRPDFHPENKSVKAFREWIILTLEESKADGSNSK